MTKTIRNGFGMLRTADPSELSPILDRLLPFEELDEGIEVRTGIVGRMLPGIQIVRNREVWSGARNSHGTRLPLIYDDLRNQIPQLNNPMELSLAKAQLVRANNGDEFIVLKPDAESRERLVEERQSIISVLGKIAAPFESFDPEFAPLDMTVAYAQRGARTNDTDAMVYIASNELPLTVSLNAATFSPSNTQPREHR